MPLRNRVTPFGDLIATPEHGSLMGNPGVAWLFAEGRLRRWSPGGYLESVVRSSASPVTVLTPRCTVRTLAAGYVPAA